jgi:hypothetical protein
MQGIAATPTPPDETDTTGHRSLWNSDEINVIGPLRPFDPTS